jgi:hypothetical protein
MRILAAIKRAVRGMQAADAGTTKQEVRP